MNLKNITFSLALLMPFALNAMEEQEESALKKAAISIIFKTSDSETPVTKDLTVFYRERGSILSFSEPLTQMLSSGAYTAHVEIKEQTDVKLDGARYTADWKRYDTLKVSCDICNKDKESLVRNASPVSVLVNGKETGIIGFSNSPLQGPATFAKLVIIAKAPTN
jgi:hypothetical protein